jgi:hypothetical protein
VKKVAALALSLLGAALVAHASPAAATDIALESRTYVPASGTDGGNTHLQLYEYLSLNAEDLVQPGFYLRAGGWGRVDLADESYGRKSNGELQYAFLGWRAPVLNAEARLGRLSVTSGVARNEVLDGLMLGSDLPGGFDVTLYGGVPVEVSEGGRTKDTLYGGRISQGSAGLYRIGASYLREQNDGDKNREEAGADVFLAPLPLIELTGSSLYNVADKAWARHEYRLVLGPFANLVRLTASWAKTDYPAYFKEPLNHALLPVEDRKQDRFGGELELLLGMGFTLSGEYITFNNDEPGDDGTVIGAHLDWAGAAASAGIGYRNVEGEAEEDQYWEASAHVTQSFGNLNVSLSGEHVAYELEINGKKTATTGTLALNLAASRSLEFTASAEYGQTPAYDREVKGLLAMTWRYDASMKKGGTK